MGRNFEMGTDGGVTVRFKIDFSILRRHLRMTFEVEKDVDGQVANYMSSNRAFESLHRYLAFPRGK